MATNEERISEYCKIINAATAVLKEMDDGLTNATDEFFNGEFTIGFNGKAVRFYVCPETYELIEVSLNTLIEFASEMEEEEKSEI